MTLFQVQMNSFLVKADGNNKTYVGMEFGEGRGFVIDKVIGETKYATLSFYEDTSLFDQTGFVASTEVEFQEGVDFLKAGLIQ